MTGPSIQSTTGPSTSGPLISDASRVPTIPMISIGMPVDPSIRVPVAKNPPRPRIAVGAGANAQFKANICIVGMDFTSNEKRPLVAVGYGPRCVPVMQLTEAAARICDVLWLIDGSIPEMAQMTDLLNRFGPVVDI